MSRAQLGHSSNLVLFYLPLWNKAYYDSLKKVKEKVSPFTPRLGHFDNPSPPPSSGFLGPPLAPIVYSGPTIEEG